MIRERFVASFRQIALSPDPDLAVAALMIARLAYPRLDAGLYLERLDALGREASRRVAAASPSDAPPRIDRGQHARIMALNRYLFGELRFVGNDHHYEDPRNSFLNEVLDRRTGIPITLALMYMEVARRAGVHVEGVNFPGHFLLRCPAPRDRPFCEDLIIDAYHGGALLSQDDLLRRCAAADQDDASVSRLLAQATKPQILTRMLHNLKRQYVRMHSFSQARDVTDLLLAVNPSGLDELRDRGLLACQLNDWSAALRDLQTYLKLSARTSGGEDEREQIWEQVKQLQRRIAALN